ncbi:MAG: [FeFe] hydrogenase, group A [Candidatus Gribaldobacteria bacterium]|nr:[FeFe] hydrogenase, group A [Candidatus Gribaldobacteria bacterium]
MKISLTINGQKIKAEAGQTILEIAQQNNIDIPSLCYHPDLSVKATCRLCLVDIKGIKTPQTACSTIAVDGMEITTESPELTQLRKTNLELIFSQHQEECADCVWDRKCGLLNLAKKYKVEITRFTDRKKDFPVYDFSPVLQFDSSKCIDCRNCVEACERQQVGHLKITSNNDFQEIAPNDDNPCIYCGQCLMHCPAGCFEAESEFEGIESAFAEAMADKDKTIVFQFAPSIRASIGEEFGLAPGVDLTGQIIAGLKQLGVNYVFDTSCGADFTTYTEATEGLFRIQQNKALPMLSSCCPSWVRFIEVYWPQFIPHLATTRSPQVILGGLIKTYWARQKNIAPENIIVVSIMPCIAKKYEISREELKINSLAPVDYVLTTRELARLFKKHQIDLPNLIAESPDELLGDYSGAGVIYGASGGVMESTLRTAYFLANGKNKKIDFTKVRGQQGLKTAVVDLGKMKVKVAVANGLENAIEILRNFEKFKDFTCIEVMACPGGCIGGGGQPMPSTPEIRQARANGLYQIDKNKKLRLAHENPTLKKVYQEFLTNEEIIKKICHTSYKN